MQRLAQQLPALLDLVCGHVMQARVVRVLFVRLGELRVELGENRVIRPGFAGWPWLRILGQPQLQTLMRRIGGEQAVDDGRAGAWQPGDEDRPLDLHVCVLRILLPRRLGNQPRDQCVADEEAAHLAAELGQVGVATVGLEQRAERLAIVVVVGAEVVEAARLGRRGVQVVDRTDIRPSSHYALYSPQFTSRAWPVIPLDRSLAMNRIADATSSSVGRRLRSLFTAAAL